MTLKVGSLFDGIFGGGLGAERAGMQVVWRSEIDPACDALMQRHRPDIPNLGDVRGVNKSTAAAVDVVIGGFPCQDLSVAGKRKGLAGERSGLWFEFHRVLAELKPGWVVIENVPGLLSSCGCIDCQTVRRIMRIHGWLRKRKGGEQCPVCKAGGRMLKSHRGRDFAVLLRGLVELGYGVSWRVLDAQYFGLAQRRKRVFIVGHLGDGASAEVLFEREGGTRDTPPSRAARESVAAPLTRGSATGSGVNQPGRRQEDDVNLIAYNIQHNDGGEHKRKDRPNGGLYVQETDTALTVGTTDMTAVVASPLRSEGHDASEDGTGRQNLVVFMGGQGAKAGGLGISETTSPTLKGAPSGSNMTPLVAAPLTSRHSGESGKWPPLNEADNLIAFDDRQITSKGNRSSAKGDVAPTLSGEGSVHVAGAVSSKWAKGTGGPSGDEVSNLTIAPALSASGRGTSRAGESRGQDPVIPTGGAVRRLTPTECERLQGFPDGWTDEGVNGKQSDSTRYRQLGNAWATTVAEWIMRRIAEWEKSR